MVSALLVVNGSSMLNLPPEWRERRLENTMVSRKRKEFLSIRK